MQQRPAVSFVYGDKDLNNITVFTYGILNSQVSNNPLNGYGLFLCINVPYSFETSMAIQFVFGWKSNDAASIVYNRIKWNGAWLPWKEL